MKKEIWTWVSALLRVVRKFTMGRKFTVGMVLAVWMPFGVATWVGAQDCYDPQGYRCRVVAQSVVEVPITRAELQAGLPGGTIIDQVGGAHFGQLRFEPATGTWDTLYYEPAPDFWSVGLDRVTLRTSAGTETLLLVAGDYRFHVVAEDFEDSDLGGVATDDPGFRLQVPFADAALGGTQGLRVMSSAVDAWVATPFPVGVDGDGQQGQHTEVGICPPEGNGSGTQLGLPGGGSNGDDAVGPTFTVLEGRLETNSAYAIAMRRQPGGYGLKAIAAGGGANASPDRWIDIAPGPHRVSARWWTTANEAGLQMLVDDRMAQSLTLPVAGDVHDHSARLGMIGSPADAPLMDFDELVVTAGVLQPGMTPIRVDDFEDGVLDGWAPQSPLQLRMAAGSAGDGWTGDWHLAVDLPAPALVLDDSPAATERFALGFWLDARALGGPAGGAVKILDVRDGDNAAGGARHLKLSVIVDEGDGASLVLRALADPATGTWLDAAPVPLAEDVGSLVVEWRRSYETVDTGYVRLWVDGTLAAELAGLANHTGAFGSYRLGAITASPGVWGTLGFDNVVTWEPAPIVVSTP